MRIDEIINPPIKEFFIVFATYGGMLLVVLTTLFWVWSGMASLGILYLIIGAPILMGIIAYRNLKKKDNSKYHNWIYRSAVLYFIIAPILLGILFFIVTEYLE